MGTSSTWAIDSRSELSYIATIMGASIRELEDTYFRRLRRSDDQLRAAFDAYDACRDWDVWALSGHRMALFGDADERT